MIIALATPRVASSVEEGLDKIKQSLAEAAAQDAEIVCFPCPGAWPMGNPPPGPPVALSTPFP